MLNPTDRVYQDALRQIFHQGVRDENYNLCKPGLEMSFDLASVFSYVTINQVPWGNVTAEALKFVKGHHSPAKPRDRGAFLDRLFSGAENRWGMRTSWFEWAHPYGGHKDQVLDALVSLKQGMVKPIVLVTWNPSFYQRLPKAYSNLIVELVPEPLTVAQRMAYNGNQMFNVGEPSHALSCHVIQTKEDLFNDTPFNLAFYGLILSMLAAESNMAVGKLHYRINTATLDRVYEKRGRERIAASVQSQFVPKVTVGKNKGKHYRVAKTDSTDVAFNAEAIRA